MNKIDIIKVLGAVIKKILPPQQHVSKNNDLLMKKLVYCAIPIGACLAMFILMGKIADCYPEHGTDGYDSCFAPPEIAYFVWLNGNLIHASILLAGTIAIIGILLFKKK